MNKQILLQSTLKKSLFENFYRILQITTFLLAVCVFSSYAQNTRIISGVVVDEKGETIPGVNIQVRGTTTGSITDMDGKFSFSAPAGNTVLQVSYIGYVTQTVNATGNGALRIVLKEDSQALDEVVVVGYGIQKKSDLTGSVSKVTAEEFQNTPVPSVEMALQGRAAGVMIMSQSGAPGSGTSIRVRGVGSVNDANDPLYVVDGIPVRDINYLSPSDIASIEILKDASATAIYGSRASNGVVLITTTRGNGEGETFRTKVKFDAYYGVQNAINTPTMLTAGEWITFNQIAYRNNPDGFNSDFRDREGFLDVVQKVTGSRDGTNWWKEVFNTGEIQNYSVNLSGGNSKISYSSSATYFKNDGIIKYSGFKRITLRQNVDVNISKAVKFTTNISATNNKRHTITENDLENGVVFGAITYDPTAPVYRAGYIGIPGWETQLIGYDVNNEYSMFGTGKYSNKRQPYAQAYRSGTLNSEEGLSLVGNAVLDIKILPWLVFKSNLGVDRRTIINDQFTPKYYLDPDEKEDNNTIFKRQRQFNSWAFENTISAVRKFGEHNVSAVAGITLEGWDNTDFRASRQGVPGNSKDLWVLNAGTFNQVNEGSHDHRSMMSYLARVNYSYGDRYLVTASVRADGSSKFLPENRWATFPSASLGWRISQEKFWQNLNQKIITNLKLRVGWGQIGNQMGLGNNDYISTITGDNARKYIFGQAKTQYTGYSPDGIGNPSIQWETSEQYNAGVDLALLDGKLTATIDYFVKNTNNMLVRVPVPRYAGLGMNGTSRDPWANQGSIKNQGLEAQLTWTAKRKKDFSYVITGNLTTVKNEVTSLGDSGPMPGGNERIGDVTLTKVGWAIGSFYGWQADGVFQNQEQIDASHMKDRNPRVGDLIFKDVDGDGKLTDDDRVNLGNPFPTLGFGLNASGQYKNVDLVLFLQGQTGNTIFRMFKYYTHQKTGYFNTYKEVLYDAWRAPGTFGPDDKGNASNTEFAINSDPALNTKASSYYTEDGSYLRLKNIQVGYNLPGKWLNPAHIGTARVYVGAQNLFTITKSNVLDPEMAGNNNGNPRDFGIDRSNYPQSLTMMFGISLTL
ncbi:SusC/RagA family TonB-linked outer membrane protein [Bacteroidia bacterium]|nr:SusC/RagA family TonB-linked outer membrane protein [Bacteroidia bacterium]